MYLAKPANFAVLEVSVVLPVLLSAPRAIVALSVTCWVPRVANRVRLARTLHLVKVNASVALLDRMPTEPGQARALCVLLGIFLLLAPTHVPSARPARLRTSLDQSCVYRVPKEHTPMQKVQCRASSARPALTIPVLVPEHHKHAKLVPQELSAPSWAWQKTPPANSVPLALTTSTLAQQMAQSAFVAPKARGARCLERSLSINATSVRTAPTTPLRAP
jgi:hypothetical protein